MSCLELQRGQVRKMKKKGNNRVKVREIEGLKITSNMKDREKSTN